MTATLFPFGLRYRSPAHALRYLRANGVLREDASC